MKNKKNYILHKIPIFILTITYIIYFIIMFINKDFSLNNNKDLINIICLFVLVILLGIISITNSKLTVFISIVSYIIYILLIINNTNIKLPNINIKKKTQEKEKSIICNGKTDISDNTIINITYKGDIISNITYTYKYDIKNKTGAENLVNHFDKLYSDYGNIYSEITISDDVIVNLYYNFKDINIDEIKKLDEKITNSYKELNEKELSKLECKNRE